MTRGHCVGPSSHCDPIVIIRKPTVVTSERTRFQYRYICLDDDSPAGGSAVSYNNIISNTKRVSTSYTGVLHARPAVRQPISHLV